MELGDALGHVAWRAPVVLLQIFVGLALCGAAIHGSWLASSGFVVLLRRNGFRGACGWLLGRLRSAWRRGFRAGSATTLRLSFDVGVVSGIVVIAGLYGGVLLSNAATLLEPPPGYSTSDPLVGPVFVGIFAGIWIGPWRWFRGCRRLAGLPDELSAKDSPLPLVAEPRIGVRGRLPRVRRVLTLRYLRTAAVIGTITAFLYIVKVGSRVKPPGTDDTSPKTLLVAVTGSATVLAMYYLLSFGLRRVFLRSQLLYLIDECLRYDARYREARRKVRDADKSKLPGNRRRNLRSLARTLPAYARMLDLLAPADAFSPRATILWGLHRRLLDHLSELDSLRGELPDDVDRLLRDLMVLVAEPRSWDTYQELAEYYGITVDRQTAAEVRPSRPGRLGVLYGNVVSQVEQANRLVVAVTVVAVIVAVLVLLLLGQLSAKDGLTLLR
ncbi:hypothetical protein [Stackebrandtia nassauensis]|uniref:Uncharacterized protein n=1 Tax=Stackebrandtia nassauensis (strain DSM 44728 / CIP 108903 / NRRL B-16338 / NBRC 102104 / LLR-40K-21) TaxID=446470 RepID=D3QAS5_STANL|nr:hypothetical protein [Stackebrandtia nassauensis]ADD44721.1 hypothetical protein Snas_5085 [Stackebrandtia nassauensis DSM 44728]